MIDLSRLCDFSGSSNTWNPYPVKLMKFDHFVLENPQIRPDMEYIRDADPKIQGRIWPRFSSYHPWFEIPSSIHVARTFARDELDAIYLDHMDNFVNLCEKRNVHLCNKDLPLFYLRDSLVGRRWNMFSQHRDITEAINYWHKFRLWIPHDTFEIQMSLSPQFMQDTHPQIFEYWSVLRFPAGVPAPAPPSLFYFYNRINDHVGQQAKFWEYVTTREYAYMFVSCWWHECERGQRAFIVPQDSIDWLTKCLSPPVLVDGETKNSSATSDSAEKNGTDSRYIIDRMIEARYASLHLRHTVRFPGTNLPPSYFVVCSRQTGHVLYNSPEPLVWVKSKTNSRLYVDCDTLRSMNDHRSDSFDNYTYSRTNMWNHIFPLATRDQFIQDMHPCLKDHLANFIRTEGGVFKPHYCDRSDDNMEPVSSGHVTDISRFCCVNPGAMQSRFYESVSGHNNFIPPAIPSEDRTQSPYLMNNDNGHMDTPTSSGSTYVIQPPCQGNIQNDNQFYNFSGQLITSAEHQLRVQQRRVHASPSSTRPRELPIRGTRYPFGSGRIEKRRDPNELRPFEYWDTQTLRNFAKTLLCSQGNDNPSAGQIAGLAQELWNMPAHDMSQLFNGL